MMEFRFVIEVSRRYLGSPICPHHDLAYGRIFCFRNRRLIRDSFRSIFFHHFHPTSSVIASVAQAYPIGVSLPRVGTVAFLCASLLLIRSSLLADCRHAGPFSSFLVAMLPTLALPFLILAALAQFATLFPSLPTVCKLEIVRAVCRQTRPFVPSFANGRQAQPPRSYLANTRQSGPSVFFMGGGQQSRLFISCLLSRSALDPTLPNVLQSWTSTYRQLILTLRTSGPNVLSSHHFQVLTIFAKPEENSDGLSLSVQRFPKALKHSHLTLWCHQVSFLLGRRFTRC
jgi:hypothetical protein